MKIQGQDITFMEYDCGENGEHEKIEPFVDLSVVVTNTCNASCHFCSNEEFANQHFDFNMDKFTAFVAEVAKKVKINKVNITGGETSLVADTVVEIANLVSEVSNVVNVNTNGTNLAAYDYIPAIDSISLSRHHYDSGINKGIFRSSVGHSYIRFADKHKVTMVCNLIKGYIDSAEEIEEYLKFVAQHGYSRAAFVGLMPVNDFSKEHMVVPDSITFDGSRFLTFRHLDYKTCGVCKYSNHLYHAEDRIVEFYMRHLTDPMYNKGSRLLWANNQLIGETA